MILYSDYAINHNILNEGYYDFFARYADLGFQEVLLGTTFKFIQDTDSAMVDFGNDACGGFISNPFTFGACIESIYIGCSGENIINNVTIFDPEKNYCEQKNSLQKEYVTIIPKEPILNYQTLQDLFSTYYIESIKLDDSIQGILADGYTDVSDAATGGMGCFENCSNIKTIYLGKSLKEIGRYSFYNLRTLENLYFNCENLNNFTSAGGGGGGGSACGKGYGWNSPAGPGGGGCGHSAWKSNDSSSWADYQNAGGAYLWIDIPDIS